MRLVMFAFFILVSLMKWIVVIIRASDENEPPNLQRETNLARLLGSRVFVIVVVFCGKLVRLYLYP